MCLASNVITACGAGGIGIRGGEGWANDGVRAHPKADSRSNTGEVELLVPFIQQSHSMHAGFL